MLIAKDIKKSFGGLEVLRGVSLEVKKGDVVAIIGSSGSGKSTFLRCLNNLEQIDSGDIRVDGQVLVAPDASGTTRYAQERDARKILRKMGMVFQSFNLFPHFTVLRNLTEAQMQVLKRSKQEASAYALKLLEKVGLSDKANQYPYQLSGGQQQRVAIARALALDPEILLFDEPTSALDPRLTQEVLAVMRDLALEDRTMIVVTHEMRFAAEVADKIVYMENGVITAEGSPDEVMGDNASPQVKAFLG